MNAVHRSFAENVNLDLRMPVKMTLNELVDTLSMDIDDDAIFILIAALDEAVCEWGFTERCFEHFKDLMEQKKIEDKEDDTWPKSRLHT